MFQYISGFFLFILFAFKSIPTIYRFWKFVMETREAHERKDLAEDLLEAQREASKTGDTKKLEDVLKGNDI